MPATIRTNQQLKTPITSIVGKTYSFRYGYERSADSILAGTEGQDYIAIKYDATRIAFALCDGVSQSFFGDIAARILGDAVLDWLWNYQGLRTSSPSIFENQLSMFLDQLTVPARRQVQQFQLPGGLALMLPEVLEKKRALGSETTFVAGTIDFTSRRVFLAWMGDSRLRLWDSKQEKSSTLLGNENFQTKERWSSHRGRIGSLHTIILSTSQIDRCILYSDGLAKLDRKVGNLIPSSTTLEQLMEDSHHFPASDDISYLEIFFGSKPDWNKPQPKTPNRFRVSLEPEMGVINATWHPSSQASLYELALITSKGWSVHETEKPEFSFKYNNLPEKSLLFCVRSWVNAESSPWSRLEKIDLQDVKKEQPVYWPPPLPPSYQSPQQLPKPIYSPNYNVPSMAKRRRRDHRGFMPFLLPLVLIALIIMLAFSIGGEKKSSPRQLTSWAMKGTEVITETHTATITLTPTIKPTKTPKLTEKSRDWLNDLNIDKNVQTENRGSRLWQWLKNIFQKNSTSYNNSKQEVTIFPSNFYQMACDDHEAD